MEQNAFRGQGRINKIGVTEDTLTGRGGLALFVRYLEGTGIYALLEDFFGDKRRSKKGQLVWKLFKQVFCFFFDGTSRHLVYFDQLKRDAGYASAIENSPDEMASSHQVKRFFKAFSWVSGGTFRKVLKRLFIWRLKIEKPGVIEMTIDPMILDNDDATKRHGVQPTYKGVLGYQSLQVIWNRKVVDSVFRGGKKHGLSGNTALNMLKSLVHQIRDEYDADVAIIVRMDSGLLDESMLEALEGLDIGFICGGKIYDSVKQYVGSQPESAWERYDNGHQEWEYVECGFRYGSWKRFWRAFYTRPAYEGKQKMLDFARPDNIILTNIGVNPKMLAGCSDAKREEVMTAEYIIRSHHQRGADELPHRGLKDFGFEKMPFKRFPANSAFFYSMLIAFFLFETYKEDVLEEVVPVVSYATTVRRQVLDFSAKIVRTSGETILKVTRAVMEGLRFEVLWERCQEPVPIIS